MSFALRATLVALGISALACSGEAPTGSDPAVTAGPDALVVPNAPTKSATCSYSVHATTPNYWANVSWSGMSVYGVTFTATGHDPDVNTLIHPFHSMETTFFPAFAPTNFQLFNKKGTALTEVLTCTLEQPV